MSWLGAVAALQEPLPNTAWEMVSDATLTTKIILAVLLAFSLASWIVIIWKWIQFRRVRGLETEFLGQVAQAQHLDEAYKSVITLSDSPYLRVFRHGMNFVSGLRGRGDNPATGMRP